MECCECGRILIDAEFHCNHGVCCEECYDDMESDTEDEAIAINIPINTPPRKGKLTKYDVLDISDSEDESYLSSDEEGGNGDDESGEDLNGDDESEDDEESEDNEEDDETDGNNETDETEDEQAFGDQIFW